MVAGIVVRRTATTKSAAAGKIQPRTTTVDAERDGMRLNIRTPGDLDTLEFVTADRQPPQAGQIEVAVSASSINFADVLLAFGRYFTVDGQRPGLGVDFAGVVTAVGPGVTDHKVGDRVGAIADAVAWGTFVTCDARLAANLPERLTAEQAGAVSTAYATAWYSLHDLARVQPGDRVLIHSATGGVGQAAIASRRRRSRCWRPTCRSRCSSAAGSRTRGGSWRGPRSSGWASCSCSWSRSSARTSCASSPGSRGARATRPVDPEPTPGDGAARRAAAPALSGGLAAVALRAARGPIAVKRVEVALARLPARRTTGCASCKSTRHSRRLDDRPRLRRGRRAARERARAGPRRDHGRPRRRLRRGPRRGRRAARRAARPARRLLRDRQPRVLLGRRAVDGRARPARLARAPQRARLDRRGRRRLRSRGRRRSLGRALRRPARTTRPSRARSAAATPRARSSCSRTSRAPSPRPRATAWASSSRGTRTAARCGRSASSCASRSPSSRASTGGAPSQIYVSRGTGYWGPPMRLGAPAEITELILRRA